MEQFEAFKAPLCNHGFEVGVCPLGCRFGGFVGSKLASIIYVESKNEGSWSHCGWMGIAIKAPCPGCGKTYNQIYNGKA